MKRFYCFVDESGQDTQGDLFVVAVVVTEEDVEQLRHTCIQIEQQTGKSVKWIKTRYERRLAYARRVLAEPFLRGRVFTAIHAHRRDYFEMTVETVALVLVKSSHEPLTATICIDGLPHSQERLATRELRRLGVAGGRVKGVRRDENDALIRLADAMCGLCRAAYEGQPQPQAIWKGAVAAGIVQELEI